MSLNLQQDEKKQPLRYGEYLHKTLEAEGASAFVDEEEDFESKGKGMLRKPAFEIEQP